MHTRRDFLKMLGLTGLFAASPKFIFDVGANLYKLPQPEHALGTTLHSYNQDAALYYVKAVSDLTQWGVVSITDNYEAKLLTTDGSLMPQLIGVSNEAIKAGQYGWVQITGLTLAQASWRSQC